MANRRLQIRSKNSNPNLQQRCTEFSLAIIRLIDSLSRDLSTGILARQLLRAATSIGANAVEATGANTKRDFINFLSIALKSAKETQYWLYLLQKSKKADEREARDLLDEIGQIVRMISSSILTAKGKR